MADEGVLDSILTHLPQGIKFACAYGSGVFQQNTSEDISNNVIDFILVVENANEWHKQNLELNRKHYSFLKHLGPSSITYLQERIGAGIYYNPLVQCEKKMIKYGVIGQETFCKDLTQWRWLYASGRLHKPVFIIRPDIEETIASALQLNLESALRASLLLLPENFTDHQLYTIITSLSYRGDFRMLIGEDKKKIENIVNGNFKNFEKLYNPFLRTSHPMSQFFYIKGNGNIRQNFDSRARFDHLCALPANLQKKILRRVIPGLKRTASIDMTEAIFCNLAEDPARCKVLVRQGVSSIVMRSSITQSCKGILTAGFGKSFIYSVNKLQKMIRGLLR